MSKPKKCDVCKVYTKTGSQVHYKKDEVLDLPAVDVEIEVCARCLPIFVGGRSIRCASNREREKMRRSLVKLTKRPWRYDVEGDGGVRYYYDSYFPGQELR